MARAPTGALAVEAPRGEREGAGTHKGMETRMHSAGMTQAAEGLAAAFPVLGMGSRGEGSTPAQVRLYPLGTDHIRKQGRADEDKQWGVNPRRCSGKAAELAPPVPQAEADGF